MSARSRARHLFWLVAGLFLTGAFARSASGQNAEVTVLALGISRRL